MVDSIPPRDGTEAQVSGEELVVTTKHAIGEATKIEASGPGTLVISRGARGLATVTALREDQERIEVEARGDTLKFDFKGGLILNRGPKGEIRYEVVIGELTELKATDGIAAHAVIGEGKSLKVKAEGGARVSIAQVVVSSFEAEVSDGAELSASGTTQKHKAKVSDGATYQGEALSSDEAEVDASGGAQATIRVSAKLKAKATGGATVSYIGANVKLDVKTDEGGDVRQIATA